MLKGEFQMAGCRILFLVGEKQSLEPGSAPVPRYRPWLGTNGQPGEGMEGGGVSRR